MRVIKLMYYANLVGLIAAVLTEKNMEAAALFVCINVWYAAEIIVKKLERSA